MDPRLPEILERCYAFICDGVEPDLDVVCAAAPELQERVARLLARERQALTAGGPKNLAQLPGSPMPQRIGEFTLLEPIGVGGMSLVYRARQEPLGREVALKVLRVDVHTSHAARLRFAREASITASLEHPHIVPVFAAGEHDGQVYLAMKLLRGRSLEHVVTRSPQEVARIGVEVASALAAAHEVGVVHRDVKPANIIVEHGRAFVVDFGLAAFADRASVLTQPDATPGTLIYLPPEVAGRRGSGLDVRADVYGLGATLYELLAGRPPFEADNPVRALQQILHDPPRPLGLRGRDRDLEVIVMRALDKSPQRRFQSAEAFAEDLQRYLDGRSIATRPPSLLRRSLRRVARHPVVSALSAVVLLLSLALVLQLQLQRAAERRELAEATAAAAATIDAGDLVAARRELGELASLPGGEAAAATLHREWAAERELQACVMVLGNPLLPGLQGYVEELVGIVAAQQPSARRAPRCQAVLALAEWQRSRSPRSVAPSFVRSSAVLAGPGSASAALARLETKGEGAPGLVLDHVLAAAALRSAGCPETDVERELRLVPVEQRSPLLLASLSLALEAQGRYREAYEIARQLLADPVCGPSARWTAARLGALLGEPVSIAALPDGGEVAVDGDRGDQLLIELAYLSELQVLAEFDVDVFWRRFGEASARCRALPQYWRLAGYVSSMSDDGEESLQQARGHFETGLRCNPDRLQQALLSVGICQLDWAQLTAQMDQGAPADGHDWSRSLDALAGRAERIAVEAISGDLSVRCAGDALLVATQCRVELGDWSTASKLFARASEIGAEEVMAFHVTLVAQFVAAAARGEEGLAPTDESFDLDREARLANERARFLLADARLEADARRSLETATLLIAAWLADHATALRLSVGRVGGLGGEAPWLAELADAAAGLGGVLLGGASSAELERARLAGMVDEMRGRIDVGALTPAAAMVFLDNWRRHPRVQQLLTGDAGVALSRALEELDRRLRR